MSCEVVTGSIYKLAWPLDAPRPGEGRPALALEGPDRYGDLRFAFITAAEPEEPGASLRLKEEDFEGEPLPHEGWLRLERPLYLPRSLVLKQVAKLKPAKMAQVLRQLVLNEVPNYSERAFAPRPFSGGASAIPPSGKVIGTPEIVNLVDASLDGWLTTGRYNAAFEKRLAAFLGVEHCITTNSGSSANLVAFATLTSPKLKERALRPGDEVITVGAGFPTTVNPILLYGMVPVFVDAHIPTYNIDPALIEAAISPRTRAIMLAHALGNPFDLEEVMRVAKKYDLWVIEDCCDALGSRYQGKMVGTFGHIGTLSFYPAHHITMGEGGAVFTNDPELKRIAESMRDWGRDCYCPPGHDNTCCKRFDWQLGDLPKGYDHKYTYSHLGYNLNITDMQAAVGLAQMERLPGFIEARRANFDYLKSRLRSVEEFLILPEATPGSEPSWFGFPVTLRPEARTTRRDLLRFLDQQKIGTRLLFAGNFVRQPYFRGRVYRVAARLDVCDRIMNDTFWLGIYPGLDRAMLDFVAEQLESYFGVNF